MWPFCFVSFSNFTDEERERHSVRPGLTGLAQVNGRNGLNWEEKFGYDLKYVKKKLHKTMRSWFIPFTLLSPFTKLSHPLFITP